MHENKIYVVAGNSPDITKYWHRIFKDMREFGLKVYCVNPKISEIDGAVIYPDLKSLPEQGSDLILVARADVSLKLVEEAIELGFKDIWFQPGTYSDEAGAKAQRAGLKVHECCFMTANEIW